VWVCVRVCVCVCVCVFIYIVHVDHSHKIKNTYTDSPILQLVLFVGATDNTHMYKTCIIYTNTHIIGIDPSLSRTKYASALCGCHGQFHTYTYMYVYMYYIRK